MPNDSKIFRINGGDDEARTRDLCRDSSAHGRNLLILGASVAPKSILNHPKSPYRRAYRQNSSKCGSDLCRVGRCQRIRNGILADPVPRCTVVAPSLRNVLSRSQNRDPGHPYSKRRRVCIHSDALFVLDRNRRMLVGMEWFLLVIVGCLIWAYLSITLNRRNSAEFDRKARKAKRFSSRVLHPPFKG